MSSNFKIASEWESESVTVEDKQLLKDFINELVGYPCKIACKANDGCVDIYVYSEKKKQVTDWIEIQPTGAIGVIYDLYKEGVSTDKLDDACEKYNDDNGLAFIDESDSDGESELSKDNQTPE
jgi:hypothetical protein